MKKHHFWTIGYSLCLIGFTVYISLDTFVLSRAYKTDATEMNTSMFSQTDFDDASSADGSESAENDTANDLNTASKGHGNGHHGNSSDNSVSEESADDPSGSVTSDTSSYRDENITITLTEYYENDTKIYAADIRLSSAEYLKTAFAEDTYGKNVTEKTSETAAKHNAVLAINGDYYGTQESGYVIRNGIVYRDKAGSADVLCIYANGSMNVADPSEKTAQELLAEGVWQAFSFGPTLVENSTVSVSQGDEVGKAKSSNPRTAIGIIDNCHYIFVVSDGRTTESEGLSLYELASFMRKLGATTAYNLDGGGSSTMYFNGEVINNPTTNGNSIKEREVSDIVYIG